MSGRTTRIYCESACESAIDKRLTHREKEGIRILDLRGQLKAGDSESTLRSAINALARDNVVNIVLNLAEVPKIDSDGLEALVLCHTQIRKRGGELKLARFNIEHLSLNVQTKLNTVVEVFVDEQDAVNSFFLVPRDSPLRHSRMGPGTGKTR